mmetsp:Transcript_25914/g.65309  ORF Transcript_25914/g.65309 Transcript_25914/m.65309 type:complete len:152 (+) Transcript_25914:414-869(+)|eukprot:g15201.t1
MGNSESTNSGSVSGGGRELKAGVNSKFYPWWDLVEMVNGKAEDQNGREEITQQLLVEVLERIDPLVKDLTSGTNIEICDKLGIDESFQPPTDWCVSLMKQIPSLPEARFNIVPRFIDEESFWCRYFAQILYLVQDDLKENYGMKFAEIALE